MKYFQAIFVLSMILFSAQGQQVNTYDKTISWLKENHIELNNPATPKGYEKFFDCDSNVVYKKVEGDTIRFYTWSASEYLPSQYLQFLQKRPYFNVTVYPQKIHESGAIQIGRLEPKTFLVSKDSLFILDNMMGRFLKLFEQTNAPLVEGFDSMRSDNFFEVIQNSTMKIQDVTDLENFKELESLRPGDAAYFRLMFHKNMFNDTNSVTTFIQRQYASALFGKETGMEKQTVDLVTKWESGGKTHYYIKVYGDAMRATDYIFTPGWTFLAYENCQANKVTIQHAVDSMLQINADSIYNIRKRHTVMAKGKGIGIDCSELIAVGIFKKYGWIDKNGNEVVPVEYDAIPPYNKELMRFFRNGRCGFMGDFGKEIIPPRFQVADNFINGLAAVKQHDQWGYINKAGREVVAPKYDEAGSFTDGLAPVKLNNHWGYINKAGREVVGLRYDEANSFAHGLAVVKLNHLSGFINKEGKEVAPCKYDYVFPEFSEGFWVVMKDNKGNVIDTMGKELVSFKYDNVDFFRNGFAVVVLNKKYGFIDRSGKEVIPAKYDEYGTFYKGYFVVKENGRLGIIDKTFKEVTPVKFDDVTVLDDDLFIVGLNGKQGVINKNGQEIIPFKYSTIGKPRDGFMVVGKDVGAQENKQGLIDLTGKEILAPVYDEVSGYFSEGLTTVKLDGKYGYFDKEGKQVIPFKYQFASSHGNGLAEVTLHDKWGLIDKQGNEVVPCKYDQIGAFSEELVPVNINRKWGIINRQGQEIVPVKYEQEIRFFKGLAPVSFGGKWGIIDKTGKEVIPFLYDYLQMPQICN